MGSSIWAPGTNPVPLGYLLGLSTGSTLIGNVGETVAQSFAALQLDNYVALRAYAGTRKSVYITGYLISSAPSGIAGMFIRDDNDVTSVDNGGTVIVATNGKRWKREYVGFASPRWWGVAPNTGVDVWAGLQAALDAAPIMLEDGIYLVTKGLRQKYNGSKLWGQGEQKTIIRAISPTGDGKFGGTSGSEAVVWLEAPEGLPLQGISCKDVTLDCNGLWTGLPSGDVRLKGHHYRRVHGFEVARVRVTECGSYAFWLNDKTIESGGVQTGNIGVYDDISTYDAQISFETTGNCWVTYNRPRALQTRSSWAWPIFEVFHFYGGEGDITVNNGYAKCDSSTIIGPLLTQKNVHWNAGYYEQLNAGTTVINMGTVTANHDNWTFNHVTMVAAGAIGGMSFGGIGSQNAKMTIIGGRYTANSGTGPILTATTPNWGVVELHGVDCKSTQVGGAVPFSLIVTGTFKSCNIFGGNQEAFGPAVGSSPVNANSAKFHNSKFIPTGSVTETVRQSKRGSNAFADGGGFGQINFAIPLNVVNKAKLHITGTIEASGTTPTGASEGVAISWNNPSDNIINILAPPAAIGRVLNWLVLEYD